MPVTYGVRHWFNSICALWGQIADDKGKKVVSYKMGEIPESVNKVPCAISFLDGDIVSSASTGGPDMVTYQGMTEFHLTLSIKKDQLGYVMPFPDKVIEKAASSITLGGKVVSFKIGTIKVVTLSWGNEEEHFGLQVPWTVIENQSGRYTVSP